MAYLYILLLLHTLFSIFLFLCRIDVQSVCFFCCCYFASLCLKKQNAKYANSCKFKAYNWINSTASRMQCRFIVQCIYDLSSYYCCCYNLWRFFFLYLFSSLAFTGYLRLRLHAFTSFCSMLIRFVKFLPFFVSLSLFVSLVNRQKVIPY